MAVKESRMESLNAVGSAGGEVKKIERFLRVLTWQMFFLLAILLYLALRPQAGRYQFTVVGDDVGVFDTSNSQAWMIKLQKKNITPGKHKGEPDVSAGEGNPAPGNQQP